MSVSGYVTILLLSPTILIYDFVIVPTVRYIFVLHVNEQFSYSQIIDVVVHPHTHPYSTPTIRVPGTSQKSEHSSIYELVLTIFPLSMILLFDLGYMY